MTDHQADEIPTEHGAGAEDDGAVEGQVAAVPEVLAAPDQGEHDISGEAITEVLAPAAPVEESDEADQAHESDGGGSGRRRRGSRRAATRPAGPPVFSAAEGEAEAAPTVSARGAVPSRSMVAAVFQAPDAAVSAVDDDDESGAAAVSDADAAEPTSGAAEGADAADGADADDDAAEAGEGKPRRRRRRGGRGGRNRKADQNDAAEGSGEAPGGSDDAGGAEDDGADGGAASPAEDGGAASDGDGDGDANGEGGEAGGSGSRRRRRRRRKGGGSDGAEGDGGADEPAEPRSGKQKSGRKKNNDEVTSVKGSTRLEAKKQRRREGRSNRGSRAPILTEAEFLARRESVERQMVVRQRGELTQIAVLEDDVLVEHYVSSASSSSMIGNVYLGRVQNVLPSMEAAFVDIGRGRNAVLYAGEVNWDAAGLEGQPKRIELALSSGDTVLVQVTKDPVGHKGARLTSQISLPGRFLVYVPQGGMTGINRKLPDRERSRLKKILREVVPDDAGVIVRTAAEGATEEQLAQDVERLAAEWERISQQAKKGSAPSVLRAEPDLAIKVARDIFNEDFAAMVVSGDRAFEDVKSYVDAVAPDLGQRVSKWVGTGDLFRERRIDEQLAKALDRKVWLPSGGSLVIDRTEAMTVVDVNTGKFTGKGGNLEETVTRNNLEAAEEIVRQLRLRDIGGIIVIDFIDMVLEDNRDLVLRRLVECLSRDRTKHQVAEVTSLGLVQMTRKRIGQGLMETFSTTCEVCNGRGVKVQLEPVGAEKSEERATRPRRPRVTGPIPGAPTTHRHTEDVAAPDVEDAVVVELSAEEELAAAALEAQEAAALADAEGAAIIEDTPSDDDVHGAVD